MNRQKVFLVVVFLIGIIFLIGINIGALHSNDQTVQLPTWLTGIGERLVSPQPLHMTDLSPEPASCFQDEGLSVPVQSTCTFAIQKSDFALRVVTLHLVQGASATVKLTQEAVLPVQQPLTKIDSTTTADLKIYPGKTQGVLRITCLDAGGAPACLVKLK